MPLPWPVIGSLAAFFTFVIMTLFSSCCTGTESDDDQDTTNSHGHVATSRRGRAIAALREIPEFRAVRYSDTAPGAPTTNARARSPSSSQVSPRTTPSYRPQTPIGTSTVAMGNPQDVSPSVYSQPSRPPTAPSTDTSSSAEPEIEGVEVVSRLEAEEEKAKS